MVEQISPPLLAVSIPLLATLTLFKFYFNSFCFSHYSILYPHHILIPLEIKISLFLFRTPLQQELTAGVKLKYSSSMRLRCGARHTTLCVAVNAACAVASAKRRS